MFDRIPLNAPEFRQIAASLNEYDPNSAIPQVAALLTIPKLQANTVRLETLVHLAVAYCYGTECVPVTQIGKWLNNYLENSKIANREDPPEDVFIGNVGTPKGNRRIFNGISHSNDYFVRAVIDILADPKTPRECRDLLVPVSALMALSERVAERLGLQRWHSEESIPWGTIELPSATQLIDRARAITFTAEDFRVFGIRRDILEPFVFHGDDESDLTTESTANSTLERCPIMDLGGDLILTLPHAVSPAIRRFVVSELRESGYLAAFSKKLANRQAREVAADGLQELRGEIESMNAPNPDGTIPQMHAWLYRYDIDKYLHVILLHDRMIQLDEQGISSFMKYSDAEGTGLRKYLNKVSEFCMALTGFEEGITLLVVGGLGRGIAIDADHCSEQWRLSVLGISDLALLSTEPRRSLTEFLKFMKHRCWIQQKGVEVTCVSGDYNLFCYWRRQNYQLVTHDIELKRGSATRILSDFTLRVRKEVRGLLDPHVLQTSNGSFVPVVRLRAGSQFSSRKQRPLYVSQIHSNGCELASVVETPRGPNWMLVKLRADNERARRFCYQVWDAFVDLHEMLVFQIEMRYSDAVSGPVEIHLNLDDIEIPKDFVPSEIDATNSEPAVNVIFEQRFAELRCPADLLRNFQQPENNGERMILKAIAKGIIGLYFGTSQAIGDFVLEDIVGSVLRDPDQRVLHIFPTDPLKLLMDRCNADPVFLADEDFAFSKLGLSDGCTSARPNTSIVSKDQCNKFLHCVVEKVGVRIRRRLKQFDRASVIRNALELHESGLQDRDHWERTAPALLSLYESTDDVNGIIQRRQLDRMNVMVASRTVLEIAICECPRLGGRPISRWALDQILADSALLFLAATHSDAIRNDLITPEIALWANGEYTIDSRLQETVIAPFASAYRREGIEDAVRDYHELNRDRSTAGRQSLLGTFSAEFFTAFSTEFGLTPDDVVNGFVELMDLAFKKDGVVVETTLGRIRDCLASCNHLSADASEAFIQTFSIFHRPAWEQPPRGYARQDLYPWRFSRRLSATVRPIFVFGKRNDDNAIFGISSLVNGCQYLLQKCEQGHLPQGFFSSERMRKYIGATNDARGHAFAVWVADQMRERKWQAKTEVKMTEFGAPADLGDVDVLAWKSDGTIQLIECKRLTFARTVAEIANICRRFQGEAKDELAKHLRRVEWIRRNPQCLRNSVGFVPDPSHIDHRLVTNTQVPMKYMDSLPMDPDKIGPLE